MSDMDSNDAALAPGTRLNGIFEIERRIASGGMGEIYRGHVIETGDPVAIKVMRTDLADNETGARAVSQGSHGAAPHPARGDRPLLRLPTTPERVGTISPWNSSMASRCRTILKRGPLSVSKR